MAASSRQLLESLFRTAVAAAHPSQCLPPNLPEPPPRGRLIVLAAGKAAGSMTEAAEQHYLGRVAEDRFTGIAVTRHGYGRPTRHIPIVEAGHPVPDEAGLKGTERALALADAAGAVIRPYFRQRVEVIDKADASPVTIADRDSEAAMRRLIAERFPEHGIFGEEHGNERVDADKTKKSQNNESQIKVLTKSDSYFCYRS